MVLDDAQSCKLTKFYGVVSIKVQLNNECRMFKFDSSSNQAYKLYSSSNSSKILKTWTWLHPIRCKLKCSKFGLVVMNYPNGGIFQTRQKSFKRDRELRLLVQNLSNYFQIFKILCKCFLLKWIEPEFNCHEWIGLTQFVCKW